MALCCAMRLPRRSLNLPRLKMSCGILSLYCKTIVDEMRRAETTNARVCGKCGNTIFDTAPQGLCSVCLFDTGLSILMESVDGSNAKDFGAANDSTSTDAAELFSACDDYELLEEIGRGGQG